MKVISSAMFLYSLPTLVPSILAGESTALAIIIFLAVIVVTSWIQNVVFIEGGELVVERLGRSIRLEPMDIQDIEYVGPTMFLKLSFAQNSEFGEYIIFAGRTDSLFRRDGPIEDDGPVFERLGKFCGWKTR